MGFTEMLSDLAKKVMSEEGQESTYDAARKMNVPKMAKGGKVPSASRRADGCATKGKTRGKMI